MSKSQSRPPIHDSVFPDAVSRCFEFLRQFGFYQVRANSHSVRYESVQAYILVFYEEYSFEIGLEVGSLIESSVRFPMSAVIRLFEPEEADRYRDYAAQTAEEIERGVTKLASQFARYVDAGLFDDPKLFEHLRNVTDHSLRQYAREVEMSNTRQKLEVAWREKNYAKVVDLLEPIRAELTASELKKLEFSKNKLRSGASKWSTN
ncbi:MAG: hypothetical protein JO093_14120 [Acidobacteria bacterium]|nr:hypothetical protein [Acidobacteriota bacterium]MBV9186752.1 hypothetical protein [Acidobacteriota bacterium]